MKIGGVKNESKDYIGMFRVQAEKLQHNEKQEERSGQIGNEQIL